MTDAQTIRRFSETYDFPTGSSGYTRLRTPSGRDSGIGGAHDIFVARARHADGRLTLLDQASAGNGIRSNDLAFGKNERVVVVGILKGPNITFGSISIPHLAHGGAFVWYSTLQ